MAQQVVTESDNFNSGRLKWEANFTELYAGAGTTATNSDRQLTWEFPSVSWGASAANTVQFAARIMIIPVPTSVSSDSYIQFTPPTSGVLDASGTDRASASGVQITNYGALWGRHVKGASAGVTAGSEFRVTGYNDSTLNATLFNDPNWYLICWVNSDDTSLHLADGRVVNSGTTLASNGYASETATGPIELATQAEVNTGTDVARAVTPATLSNFTGQGVGGYLDANGVLQVRTGPYTGPTNLLYNGDGELGTTTGNPVRPYGWSLDRSATAVFDYSTTVFHSGTQSLHMYCITGTYSYAYQTFYFVRPGETVTVDFWYKIDTVTGSPWFEVSCYANSGAGYTDGRTFGYNGGGDIDWTHYTNSFVVPAGTSTVQAYMYMDATTAGYEGQMWVDDFKALVSL